MLLVDLEAERAALGLALFNRQLLAEQIFANCTVEHFAHLTTRTIFLALLTCWRQNHDISVARVLGELRKAGKDKLTDEVLGLKGDEGWYITASDWPAIRDRLEAALARRQVAAAIRSLDGLTDSEESADVIRAKAAEVLAAIRASAPADESLVHVGQAIGSLGEHLEARRQGKKAETVDIGFPDLSRMLGGGLLPGELTIVAGRPAMGKTSFALAASLHVARHIGPVLYLSLEMSARQIAGRVMAREMPIEVSALRGVVDDATMERFNAKAAQVSGLPLWICDKRGLTISQAVAVIHAANAQYGPLKLVVVDQINLLRPDRGIRADDAYAMLGEFALRLRELAGEIGCPVISLHQLNRGVETREKKRPVMSDLRDSGRLEEHADTVILLYREAYYHPDECKEQGVDRIAELIVAKARDGRSGIGFAEFIADWACYQAPDSEAVYKYTQMVLNRAKDEEPF